MTYFVSLQVRSQPDLLCSGFALYAWRYCNEITAKQWKRPRRFIGPSIPLSIANPRRLCIVHRAYYIAASTCINVQFMYVGITDVYTVGMTRRPIRRPKGPHQSHTVAKAGKLWKFTMTREQTIEPN